MKITGYLVCGSCKVKHPVFDDKYVIWGSEGNFELGSLSGLKKFQCCTKLTSEEREKVLYRDHMALNLDEGMLICQHFVEVPAMYWAEVPESSKG